MRNMIQYRRSVTTREGKKVSISDAQMAEVFKILNEDSEGLFYDLIRGGVFVPDSTPDSRDSDPNDDAIKAVAKRL